MTRAALALVALGSVFGFGQTPPKLMLWAWERDTDLRFLKPADAGVAWHFATLSIEKNGTVLPSLRAQPLQTAQGAFLMPVIRINVPWDWRVQNAQQLRTEIAEMFSEALRITRAGAIQIDFDAPKSAYPFYRALLGDVRRRIGSKVFLSMTALVSWCGADSWMKGLPVDEIVPMGFRLGYPPAAIPEQFPFAACRQSFGIDVGDRYPLIKHDRRRIYAFPSTIEWDAKNVAALQNELR